MLPRCLDHSRICRKAKHFTRFHTEVTEAKHREHGEVPEIFSVHSVVDDLDPTWG